jgi:hypothetical protein
MYWIFFLLIVLFSFLFVAFYDMKKKEGFSGYSHTVNLPINTSMTCENTCGPPNRCSVTGEQCTSDVDCYGCQTQSDAVEAPPVYFQGVNTWREAFDVGNALYNQKYNPSLAFQPFLPHYPSRPTVSGEFVDDGPLAANS